MRVFVKAFMDKNFGDDLMIIKLLKTFPNTKFYINCPQNLMSYYNEILSEFDNYKLTTVELRKIRKFKQGYFTSIILIGGSVLQGSRNIGCYYRFRNILAISYAKLASTKYFIIGCNTGPFINKMTQFFVGLEIRLANLITTRDEQSFDFIKKYNKSDEKYMFPDMLMDISQEYRIAKKSDSKILGISTFNSKDKNLSNDNINIYFAKLIDSYIEKTGNRVKLIAFDTGVQNDLAVSKRIYELLEKKENVEIVSHDTRYLNILEEMAECSKIIALRFHSAILAMSLAIPTLPLIYSNKTENLLKNSMYNSKLIKINEISKISIEDMLKILDSDEDLLYAYPSQIDQSSGHMKVLKKYIR